MQTFNRLTTKKCPCWGSRYGCAVRLCAAMSVALQQSDSTYALFLLYHFHPRPNLLPFYIPVTQIL